MKKLLQNKWLLLGLFVIVIAINYLSTIGLLLPNTQQEVSDKYLNYYAPAGYTFSVWGVIYLGVALTIYLEFKHRNNKVFTDLFNKKVKPFMVAWMILNIIWTLFWSYEVLLLSLFAIALYGVVLFMLANNINKMPVLKAEFAMLVVPVGLHLGWIIAATFANAMTALTQSGIAGINNNGLILTIVCMGLALLLCIGAYLVTHNIGVVIVGVWAFAGITMKHAPGTDFLHPSMIIFVLGIVACVVIAVSPIIIKTKNKVQL